MALDRAVGHVQSSSDLGVRQSLRHGVEHLGLTAGHTFSAEDVARWLVHVVSVADHLHRDIRARYGSRAATCLPRHVQPCISIVHPPIDRQLRGTSYCRSVGSMPKVAS